MRKANQPDPSTNGQLRIVGDHLGSTTLIVDTSSPPQVIHRQYYKPYGEVATQSGTSRTSISYTGQRLDEDSGLMHYGARMYDPVLSYFISPDTVSPSKGNPKSRNRYSYVLNNPLRYTDATGQTPDDAVGVDNAFKSILQDIAASADGYNAQGAPEDERASFRKCMGQKNAKACRDTFARLGIRLEEDWDWNEYLWELQAILEGIHDLMDKAGWSYADFKNAMGISNGYPLVMKRERRSDQWAAWTGPDMMRGNTNMITFYDGASGAGYLDAKVVTVHELAHVWDGPARNCQFFGCLSREMTHRTGSFYLSVPPPQALPSILPSMET